MFWFFKKKDNYEPGEAVEKRAEEKFVRLKKCRFKNETGSAYTTEIRKHELIFRLLKKNLFAWCESSFFSCTDFTAEADFSFDTDDSYSSAGIIFRKGSDYNYYYFLVSDKGYFRVDCVFNGKPMPMIEWTPLSSSIGQDVSIKVTGLGGYFNFHVNNEKVCSLHDEIIAKGDITFCCQNYDVSDTAEISLKRFSVNSVAFDVEEAYSDEKEIALEQKYNLAKSMFERGKFETAAVWMEKIIRNSDPAGISSPVYSLYSEILLNLGMYDEALKCLDKAIEIEPGNVMLILEKGNLLYQQGRYLDLNEFLEKNRKYCRKNPVYRDLKGHAAFFLGRTGDALENYLKAASYDPENPYYFYNAGRCAEADDIIEAAEYYKKALILFFRQDSTEDIHNILSWFESSEIDDPAVESIKGKVFFSENNFSRAEEIFRKLIDSGGGESEVYYLNALIEYRKGNTEEALKNIETSCSLEPDYPLYFFRLAEMQYASSIDPLPAVNKALELDPDDEWINNLAGLISLDNERYKDAANYFEKAFIKNQDDRIIFNYSEALLKTGDFDRAVSVLDSADESLETVIRKGAVLAASERYSEAYEFLESSHKEYPDNLEIMKILAEVCYQSEKLSRSEEILYLLEEKSPDSSVYNMIGNAARLKGEYSRADASYLKSLEIEYNPVVALNYIEGICERQDYYEAHNKIYEYFGGKDIPESLNERYCRIRDKILKETEITLSCATCSREWTVLKNTVMNQKLKIIGEPDPASPAGRCPSCGRIYCVECALKWLDGQRFTCSECGEYLKLNDDYLRFIVSEYTGSGTKTQLS